MKFQQLSAISLFALFSTFALVQAFPAPKEFQVDNLPRSTIESSTQPQFYYTIIIKKSENEKDEQIMKLEKRACYGDCGGRGERYKGPTTCTAENHCEH